MLTQLVYILDRKIKSCPDVKFCAHAQCVLPRCSKIMASCSLGGVRTGIAKHHGRYSKSDWRVVNISQEATAETNIR